MKFGNIKLTKQLSFKRIFLDRRCPQTASRFCFGNRIFFCNKFLLTAVLFHFQVILSSSHTSRLWWFIVHMGAIELPYAINLGSERDVTFGNYIVMYLPRMLNKMEYRMEPEQILPQPFYV